MNLRIRQAAPAAKVARQAALVPAPEFRRDSRPRDFGIGYGRSSGYAQGRRYASNWGNTRFEFC
ncbi:hypothetical protein [Luteimonas aquatica]|uniref:hypothetical protein n=1 Tax=Luteimonas aquatica TaxID=450364 RepID=UPI001F591E0C|nr:hypothetical protein [Luteimonas aquatica]